MCCRVVIDPDLQGTFTRNLPKSYTVQYPNGTFFVLKQNWDIESHGRKLQPQSTILSSSKAWGNDLGGFGKVIFKKW